jgi:hypothetical protein
VSMSNATLWRSKQRRATATLAARACCRANRRTHQVSPPRAECSRASRPRPAWRGAPSTARAGRAGAP